MEIRTYKHKKNNEKFVLHYVSFGNSLSFKLDFQKVYQYTGGMWLIPGTKHHKDNQLQS